MIKNLLSAFVCIVSLSCVSDCYCMTPDPADYGQSRLLKKKSERLARLNEKLSIENVAAVKERALEELLAFSKNTLKRPRVTVTDADIAKDTKINTALDIDKIASFYASKCDKHINDPDGEISQWFQNAKTVLLALDEMNQLVDFVPDAGDPEGPLYLERIMKTIAYQVGFFDESLALRAGH